MPGAISGQEGFVENEARLATETDALHRHRRKDNYLADHMKSHVK